MPQTIEEWRSKVNVAMCEELGIAEFEDVDMDTIDLPGHFSEERLKQLFEEGQVAEAVGTILAEELLDMGWIY